MKNSLTQLLNEGEDLVGLIEDTCHNVERQLSEIGQSANEIDGELAELSRQADDLHRQIAALRSAPPAPDAIAPLAAATIDKLIGILNTAKDDLANGLDLAAIGALILFEEPANDLRAVLRIAVALRRPS